MSRLADNPEKRKGLQVILFFLVAGFILMVVAGVVFHFLDRDEEHKSDPSQMLSAPVERN